MNALEIVAIIVLCILGVINILLCILTVILPDDRFIMSHLEKIWSTPENEEGEKQ